MWLLILAIVILFISALLSSFYAPCLIKEGYQRPVIFIRHEMFFIYSNIMLFLTGITMLFIATDLRWVIVGLFIYWMLVVLLARWQVRLR